jgi:ribose 5-phosphate isomerase B
MKIALASDHAGFELKQKVLRYLAEKGIEVEDLGPDNPGVVDYPDYAAKVARRVAGAHADMGVLVCGTGVGMMLAANKVPGIRAVPAHDTLTARLGREHNDANVLALGARMLDESAMRRIVDTWLATPFAGGRHERRVGKITRLEPEMEKSS